MPDCRITVMRRTFYRDLAVKYENPIDHPCGMFIGESFICKEGKRPEGLCESAWETIRPFAEALAEGGGNFYGNWMKNPKSAMISCNDGFRPVTFYVEAIE